MKTVVYVFGTFLEIDTIACEKRGFYWGGLCRRDSNVQLSGNLWNTRIMASEVSAMHSCSQKKKKRVIIRLHGIQSFPQRVGGGTYSIDSLAIWTMHLRGTVPWISSLLSQQYVGLSRYSTLLVVLSPYHLEFQ